MNRALSAANSCLYGLCHAAILSGGYSPGLGFIHTGKQLSFVYDVADLYKATMTIPIAFEEAARCSEDLEPRVRRACRNEFRNRKLVQQILPDIAAVLDITVDDTAPDEALAHIYTSCFPAIIVVKRSLFEVLTRNYYSW